jgi:hypothetical protein
VTVASEIVQPELEQRDTLVKEEARLHEVLELLAVQLRFRALDCTNPSKSRRVEVRGETTPHTFRPSGSIEEVLRSHSNSSLAAHLQVARRVMRAWMPPPRITLLQEAGTDRSLTFDILSNVCEKFDSASVDAADVVDVLVQCFPLQSAREGSIVMSFCGRLLIRGVEGCGVLLGMLVSDRHGQVDVALQCIVAQLRLRGAESDLVDCINMLFADASFSEYQGAVTFLHEIFLIAIGLISMWTSDCTQLCRKHEDAVGSPGSSLWHAVRLLLFICSRIPVGSVRFEDATMVYRALSSLDTHRSLLMDAFGEGPLIHLNELLRSTLSLS